MLDFSELSEEEKQFYYDKASEILTDDLLICTRDWSAWRHKTMTEDDFSLAYKDDTLIIEIAEKIYDIVKVKIRKIKIDNILKEEN